MPNAEGLEPGQVTEVFSFDHDLQKFLPIGTATVADDGSTLTTDPGFGIVKAGWHWPCGGSSGGSGTAHDCQQCFECRRGRCRVDPERVGEPCDDKDPCTFDDRCQSSGQCIGIEKRFVKVVAKADGDSVLAIREVGEELRFSVVWELNRGSCQAEYLWSFGDGNTSTERSPGHAFEVPGEYHVRVGVSCTDCNISGTDSVRAVAAKVEIKAEATDRNRPQNRARISVFEGRPVFAGDRDVGDFVYYEAQVQPALAARLAESYVWKAEGPESRSGPSGSEEKWEIEDQPIDWTPGEYMVEVEVHLEGFPATLDDEFRQVVGVRTPEYFYVGAITDVGPISTAGVEDQVRTFFSCPAIFGTLLLKFFGLVSDSTFNTDNMLRPWWVPEEVEDRLFVMLNLLDATLNRNPAAAVRPDESARRAFGLFDFIHYRGFSRLQFRYLAENGVLTSELDEVGNNQEKIGLTPSPCLAVPGDLIPISTAGEAAPDSNVTDAPMGASEFTHVIKYRAGQLAQIDFEDLLRRILPWVFFRYRFNVADGLLISRLEPFNPDPDGPGAIGNTDRSPVPAFWVFRRNYDRDSDSFDVELVDHLQNDVLSFLENAIIMGSPSYP